MAIRRPTNWMQPQRERKGLSLGNLEEALGISRSLLSRYETGQRTPSTEVQERIAEVLEADPDELFGDYPSPTVVLDHIFDQRRSRGETKSELVPEEQFKADMEWLGEDLDALSDWDSPVVITEDALIIDWSRMPSELECAEGAVDHHTRQIERAEEHGRDTAPHQRSLQRAELRLGAALRSVKQARARIGDGPTRARARQPHSRKRRTAKSASSSDDPGEPEPDEPSRQQTESFAGGKPVSRGVSSHAAGGKSSAAASDLLLSRCEPRASSSSTEGDERV